MAFMLELTSKKQERPKEINRPWPWTDLWLVGIKWKSFPEKPTRGRERKYTTDCIIDGLDVEFKRADHVSLLNLAEVLVALVHHLAARSYSYSWVQLLKIRFSYSQRDQLQVWSAAVTPSGQRKNDTVSSCCFKQRYFTNEYTVWKLLKVSL